ncbi:hypothetical protein [Streptomyces synnematoformans]|uniref:Secreted protein n=1 Tax=Streptomyces synnematoformans TaxID=415721 RepID=A0ABN2XMG3_9ACTN
MRTRTKLLLAAGGIASAGATVAGVAVAADPTDNVKAPYAQAAVAVNTDGTISRQTDTIDAVTKTATGRYCITLAPGVEAARSVPVATLHNGADWRSEIYVQHQHSSCADNAIRVTTGTNGAAKDQPFYVVIP